MSRNGPIGPHVIGRAVRLLPLAVLLLPGLLPSAASAQAQVVYVNTTEAPAGGTLLPATPTTTRTVHAAIALGTTFDNACFPESYSGPSSVDVDGTTHTITVDFDESGATSFPFCPLVYIPVSHARIDFGPLEAGHWTLQIDGMLAAYPLGPIAPQTIEFDVVEVSSVPIASPFALPVLLGGALLVAGRRIDGASKA